jgi:hypothetical protein
VVASFDLRRNRERRTLDLVPATRKCLHYYHYYLHPQLGFLHARLATWLPLTMHVCINGREWLAKAMDQAGLGYRRRENCFTHLSDPAAAQALVEAQLKTDWPQLLADIARRVNPITGTRLSARCPVDYYWSADQTEWASDVMFQSPQALAAVYPALVHHGIEVLACQDVLRFLGRRVRQDGTPYANFAGEVTTDLATRPEGVCIKHRLNGNTIKMYDKQGSVLRVETTINEPRDMKVYRPAQGASDDAPKRWQKLRKGVADLHRRAELSQAANQRYLASLATVTEPTPLGTLTATLCQPARWKGRRVRALNPLAHGDAALLEAVSHGEFALTGFGNKHLRQILHGRAATAEQRRRQAAATTRKIRLLRAHGLIRKISSQHRYHLTELGRTAIHCLLMARNANAAALAQAA